MYDCIIVGAGPAGGTAAYHLPARSVLVLEKKRCHGISRAVVECHRRSANGLTLTFPQPFPLGEHNSLYLENMTPWKPS